MTNTRNTEYGTFPTKHWGIANQREIISPAITQYWTPSHGGFEISMECLLSMPAEYRACSFSGDNCFEEDCSWCGVVLSWPLLFASDHVQAARAAYDQFYANKAA